MWNPDLYAHGHNVSIYPFCLSHGRHIVLNAGVLWLQLYDLGCVSSAWSFPASATWDNYRNPLRYSGTYVDMKMQGSHYPLQHLPILDRSQLLVLLGFFVVVFGFFCSM